MATLAELARAYTPLDSDAVEHLQLKARGLRLPADLCLGAPVLSAPPPRGPPVPPPACPPFLPGVAAEAYLASPLGPLTPETVLDVTPLRKELAQTRERGYATSFGERQSGAGAVAAPLFGYDSKPLAVLSVSGPIDRFRDEVEDAAKLLLKQAVLASERMGHRIP